MPEISDLNLDKPRLNNHCAAVFSQVRPTWSE